MVVSTGCLVIMLPVDKDESATGQLRLIGRQKPVSHGRDMGVIVPWMLAKRS